MNPEDQTQLDEIGEKHTKLIEDLGERLNSLFENIRNPDDRAAAKAKLQEAVGLALQDLKDND